RAAVLVKDLLVPDHAPLRRVEANGAERLVVAVGHGGREVDAPAGDHRRRPAETGDRLAPCDVLALSPLSPPWRAVVEPLSRRPAELRPFRSKAGATNDQCTDKNERVAHRGLAASERNWYRQK